MRRVGVVVAGGGLSGLAAAYELVRLGADACLVEKERRLGGLVTTETAEGFVMDGGPDAFLTSKPQARELCAELGLQDALLPTNPNERRVYVLLGGRLRPLPDGMRLTVPTRVAPLLTSTLFTAPGKLRLLAERLVPRRTDAGEESIADFVRRRFGAEALERVGEPLLAGIHCGAPETLSMDLLFPRLVELESVYGSVSRGMARAGAAAGESPFVSLAGGMSRLVEALRARIPKDSVVSGDPVARVGRDGSGFVVELASGEAIGASALVLALPIRSAESLTRSAFPAVARALSRVRTASTAVVFHAFAREDVSHPLDGYGFVVPRTEPSRLLAATFVSTKFPDRAPAGTVLIRTFLGGSREPDVLDRSDDELTALSASELAKAVGRLGAPRLSRVVRWKERTPQVEVGHRETMTALADACAEAPGLRVIGNGLQSVGIPDSIGTARETARGLVAEVRLEEGARA